MRVIDGCNQNHVITAVEALVNPERVGEHVVVIGGGNTGCEVAEYFGAREYTFTTNKMKDFSMEMIIEVTKTAGEHNRDVTVVEMMPQLCPEREGFSRRIMMKQLEINNVKIRTKTKVHKITDKAVQVVDMNAGDFIEIPADTVILAGGLKPENIEVAEGVKTMKLGDANAPSLIADAIFSAYCAAYDI